MMGTPYAVPPWIKAWAGESRPGLAACLRDDAHDVAHGEPICRQGLRNLCEAFGGRDWIGHFDHPLHTPEGRHERVMALCLAAAMADAGDL